LADAPVTAVVFLSSSAQRLRRVLFLEKGRNLMTQAQLDREVAAVTGESRRMIHNRGFSLVEPLQTRRTPEPTDVAKFLDWDDVAGRRYRRLGVF
jgi:hypothetical protein